MLETRSTERISHQSNECSTRPTFDPKQFAEVKSVVVVILAGPCFDHRFAAAMAFHSCPRCNQDMPSSFPGSLNNHAQFPIILRSSPFSKTDYSYCLETRRASTPVHAHVAPYTNCFLSGSAEAFLYFVAALSTRFPCTGIRKARKLKKPHRPPENSDRIIPASPPDSCSHASDSKGNHIPPASRTIIIICIYDIS